MLRRQKDKPQGTQREMHTRITMKIGTFVSFVKTLVSLVVKIFFLSLSDRFLTMFLPFALSQTQHLRMFEMTGGKLFTHRDSRQKISGMTPIPYTFHFISLRLHLIGFKIHFIFTHCISFPSNYISSP